MVISISALIFGIIILVWGADRFIENSSIVAKKLGISELIIGLTLVAFGTSAPEIFVGISGIFYDNPEIATGTVIGSNISNIALIFGIACFSFISRTNVSLVSLAPFLLSVILLGITLQDGLISHLESGLFILVLLIFLMTLMKSNDVNTNQTSVDSSSLTKTIVMLLVGLTALIIGSNLAVTYGVAIAEILQVPEIIIGLTVLALGTSLPELAASISALFKKKNQMIIGNIIGSNIMNLVFVIPIVGFFSNINLFEGDLNHTIINRDYLFVAVLSLVFMIVILILRMPNFYKPLAKIFGLFFVLSYFIYIGVISGLLF
tara:strand:+ start:873 stop:1829 length:957 start_codon:yes stop_codon:yes gene_type:complete